MPQLLLMLHNFIFLFGFTAVILDSDRVSNKLENYTARNHPLHVVEATFDTTMRKSFCDTFTNCDTFLNDPEKNKASDFDTTYCDTYGWESDVCRLDEARSEKWQELSRK